MNTRYNILPNFTILIIDDIGFIGGLFVDELNNMNSLHNTNIKLVIPMKVARLAQTFGYGIDSNDNRVFAQFARAAYEKKDIVLHTKGLSMRNYCESKDDINVIFDIPEDTSYGYAADTNIRFSSEKLCRLGWKPTKNLEQMYKDLINQFDKDN